MKRYIIFFNLIFVCSLNAQNSQPVLNFRISFLLVPFSPLFTIEVNTYDQFTLQLESNFVNTHGANIKYFTNSKMNEHYAFLGMAYVKNKLLREDKKYTYLPYGGYGYAHRFGNNKQWTFDNRIGIGSTLNADQKGVYPIIKTGLGFIISKN